MDALSRIMRSSPQKSEGANSKKSMNYSWEQEKFNEQAHSQQGYARLTFGFQRW